MVKVTGDAPAGSKQKVIVVGYVHEGRRGERRGEGGEEEERRWRLIHFM